jgi:hypothetical protein
MAIIVRVGFWHPEETKHALRQKVSQHQRPERQATEPYPGDLRAQSADADMVIAELNGQ